MKINKLLNILKKSFVGLIILFSVHAQAGGNEDDSFMTLAKEADWVPSTSLYVELAGKFLPSFNVDFRKRENFAISFGTGLWKDNEEHEQFIITPSVNTYYLFGKRKRIELGGGAGPFLSTYEGFASLLIYGNIGYRYQKKKGLIFRAGFTPFVAIPINDKSRFMPMPWAGISLGYSF